MPSIYLTPKPSSEARFRMFIINGYYIKSKRLQFLDFLLKDVIFCSGLFDWTGNTVDETASATLEPIH